MEHNRKQKLLVIVALVVGIVSLSIGFAAFSVSLNISSSASVSPNSDTFSVKFSAQKDSLVVHGIAPSSRTPYLQAPTDGVIDNSTNPTLTGLSAIFTNPGQYVEYKIYARNEGEYTAYLNNVNFIGDKICTPETGTTASLVTSACDSIKISANVDGIDYTETTPVTGHSLAVDEGEPVIIRLEYLSSGVSVDGPFSITFPDIALVYSTIDDSSIQPTVKLKPKIVSGNLNVPGSIVSIGDEQFYVIGQENGNLKLFAKYNLYVGNIIHSLTSMKALSDPTGLQSEVALAELWDSETGNVKYPWVGTTAFATSSPRYSGSIVEGYVNNYESYLTSLGINIVNSRLISLEEIESLGCNIVDETCADAPEWLYKTTYFTGSTTNASINALIWYVGSNSDISTCSYMSNVQGVRPVIEIPLSEF